MTESTRRGRAMSGSSRRKGRRIQIKLLNKARYAMKYMMSIIMLLFMNCTIYGQNYNFRNFMEKILEWYVQEHPDIKNLIAVQCHEDEHHYYMDIYEDNYGIEYYKDAICQSYSGRVVAFWGEHLPPFLTEYDCEFKLNPSELYQSFEPEEENRYINSDPDIWSMAFHEDGTLCKMFTYMTTPLDSLNENIIDLASKYLGGYTITDYDKCHVYMFVDHQAEFPGGNTELRKLMTSLLTNQSNCEGMSEIPVIIKLMVNTDGKSNVMGFVRQSGDRDLDAAAMRAAQIMANTSTFNPASHRNETVRTYFFLAFTKAMFSCE